MSNPGFVTNPNGFKVTYTIEYVDDKKTWEKICNNEILDPWTVYKKKEFDNASEAMTLYAYWRCQDNIYDVKMWQKIETTEGKWYEEYIEFDTSFRYGMESRVNKEMRKENEELHKENSTLVEENTKLIAYLKKHNVDVYSVLNE